MVLFAFAGALAPGRVQAQTLFATCSVPLPGRIASGVTSEDFNGDGIPDAGILDSRGADVLFVFSTPALAARADCSGLTERAARLEFGDGLALAGVDLANNGSFDVVLAQRPGLGALRNDGTGMFTSQVPIEVGISAQPHAVATGDFNLDGIVDVAVGTHGTNSVQVLFGVAGGGFREPPSGFLVDVPVDALVVGDFNLDARPDLLVVSGSGDTGSVKILLNSTAPPGTFTLIDTPLGEDTPARPVAAAVGDFNRDSLIDVAIVDSPDVVIFLPTPPPFTATPSPTPTSSPGETPSPTATAEETPTDSPTVGPTTTPTATPTLARTPLSPGSVVVFLNRSTPGQSTSVAFEAMAPLNAGRGPIGIAVGDLVDIDGILDIVVSASRDDRLIFFEGQGDGNFTEVDPCENDGCEDDNGNIAGCCTDPGPRGIALARLDSDPRDDIFVAIADGMSLDVFISSAPTPSPTAAPPTIGSHTPTSPPTTTPTGTPVPSFTSSQTPVPTATCPPGAAICVQGEGCANIAGGTTRAPYLLFVALGVVVLMRRFAR